jgi:hypothetical protein
MPGDNSFGDWRYEISLNNDLKCYEKTNKGNLGDFYVCTQLITTNFLLDKLLTFRLLAFDFRIVSSMFSYEDDIRTMDLLILFFTAFLKRKWLVA